MTPGKETLRFAIFGTGFWSRFQLAGWNEVEGARCVALYNRTRAKAEALGREFGIEAVFDDAEKLLDTVKPDFIDIITDVDSHSRFVELAANHRIPVICQKPMAPDLETARAMTACCESVGIPFLIHENWRWQKLIRDLKAILDSGVIGTPFRAGIDMISGFPVFENQPFLAELEQFIITDLGSHTLDTARFLFGEAASLTCRTGRVHPNIRGEDHATILLTMGQTGMTVIVRLAYAGNHLERECFPQTLFFIEGSLGSIEVTPDYWIRVTTESGTHSRRHPPPHHPWADPRYAAVHSAIPPCNANLLSALNATGEAETTAADNLRTMTLVFDAYDSEETGKTIVRPA